MAATWTPSASVFVSDLAGKRVGIDAFLTAFQFLTTMRDRSPEGDGMPLRAPDGRYVALRGSFSVTRAAGTPYRSRLRL